MADVRISNQGSLSGVTPLSDVAKDWIDDNVHSEGWQWLGPTLYVDHRMIDQLLNGMIVAGLELTD